MVLRNKLGLTDQIDLAKAEERISKKRARALYDTGDLEKIEVGTFRGLAGIHAHLFEEIYDFAGKIRDVNMAKGTFRFAPLMYLDPALFMKVANFGTRSGLGGVLRQDALEILSIERFVGTPGGIMA